MFEQKKEEYMRFGQIVRIHSHRLSDSQSGKRGMIVAKGFTDSDAKYQTFETFRNCKFYRQALFQVLPKGIFQHSRQNLSIQVRKKLMENYQLFIKQRMGQIIKFGEEVVFKHVDSQQYLSGSKHCSKGGLGAFKVQLTRHLQKDLIFKMYSFQSFEKQGQKIKLQSPLRIKNMQNGCYISTQKNRTDDQNQMKIQDYITNSTDQKQLNIVMTYSQNFTWLFHLHQGHQNLNQTQQIRTHDIILLTCTKNDGYLCLSTTQEGSPFRAMVRMELENTGQPCYACLWEIQKQPIPEISPYPDKKRGTQGTYTLRDVLTGQHLKVYPFQKESLQKGLSTTTLQNAKLDQDEVTIKSAKGMTNPIQYVKNNGLVKISGPKKASYVQNGEIYVHDTIDSNINQNKYIFRQKMPYDLKKVVFLTGEGEHGFRIQKIDQNSKREVLFILSTYQVLDDFIQQLQSNNTSNFQEKIKAQRFYFIDSFLQKLIAFIKDCDVTEIQQDILPNRKKQYMAKDLKICQKLFMIVKEMGIKILDQVYKKQKAQNDAFKVVFVRTYYLILQIIKNNPITKLHVCQGWLQIILNHAIENQQQIVHQTLNQILQSNELVVAKFLKADNYKLIMRIINVFSLKPPHQKFLNIFSASCMSNGAPIVANQKLILDFFLNSLDQHAQFKFIKPRAAYGFSMDTALDPNKLYIKCSISKDQNKIRSMKDFFEESARLDLSQTSNYFIAYLNLLADICYGRNTQAKKYVQKILSPITQDISHNLDNQSQPFDALYTLNQILKDKQIEQIKGYKNLFKAVLRIINYAFVQSVDQIPVLRINRYRNIDQMDRQTNDVSQKFTRLKNVMNFVKQKLQNFKSFYQQHLIVQIIQTDQKIDQINKAKRLKKYQQMSSIQDKQFLLTQLQLLKSTLIIGFWKVEQQQQLLPILLKVLTNSKKNILHYKQQQIDTKQKQLNEIRSFKQQARRHTPTVQLITSCKALVCQLIQIIFDFRHDDLVTKCVTIYKQMDQQSNICYTGQRIVLNQDLEIQGEINQEVGRKLYNVNQWKEKLKIIFSQKRENEQNPSQNDNKMMVPLMVQLGIHQNPTLFFRSLLILKRLFQYRADILKLFLNLSLYDTQTGGYLSQEICKKRKQLNALQQENLLYIKQKGAYDNSMEFLVWLSQATKENFDLEKRPNRNQFRCIFDHFHERSRIDQFRQRTIKNKDVHPVMLKFIGLSRQSLGAYSQDARNVLKYVYRFLALLCKGFLEAKLQIYHKQRVLSVIKDHIKQEVDLLKHNDMNKEDLTNLQRVRRRDDCQAIQLLAQLFSHNKTILFNESQIEQTCQSICQLVNKVSLKNYYKSHLLDFCRSLIYYKDQQISANQSKILAKLQDPNLGYIYYRDKNPQNYNQNLSDYIISLVSQFSSNNQHLLKLKLPGKKVLDQKQNKDLIIGPELTYFVTLFNLFANLVQGKHVVNIGKGRQVHSYQMLMKILKKSDLLYPLKANIRNYINQLYYTTPIQQSLYNQIIKQQFPQLIQDLNDIISILVKQKPLPCYVLAHPIRYNFYDTYLFLYVQQILFSLNNLFCEIDNTFFRSQLMKQLTLNYSRGYFYLHYFIIRIYQRLRWLTNHYYQHPYVRGMLNMISSRIRKQYLDQFRKSSLRIFDRDQQKGHEPSSINSLAIPKQKKPMTQRRQQQLIKRCGLHFRKLVKGEITDFFIEQREQDEKNKNFPLTFILPYQQKFDNDTKQIVSKKKEISILAQKLKIILDPNIHQKSNKIDYYYNLQTISNKLWENISFGNFIDQYFINNCTQLYRIDHYSKILYNFQIPFVSFQQYIKIFVQVNSQKPQSIPNNLRIFFFKIIFEFIKQQRTNYIINNNRLSIQQKDQQISKSIDNWQKQDWKDVAHQIHKKQNFLAQSSVAELIIQSLKIAEDIQLYYAILKFSIAYLLGGQKTSQNSIYQKLKQDEKNNVFIKLQKLISRLGKKIANKIIQKTIKIIPSQQQFFINQLDLNDYYDSRINGMKKFQYMNLQDKFQQKQQNLEKQVFKMTFKFLQLLCQCNHIQLKAFVRQQININGDKKNHSFNLINVTIFQVRRLFKVMNKQASTTILPLIDFVNEVVTIPCIQNQKGLVQTTFFQDLCHMASLFRQKGNIKQRGFDQPINCQLLNNIYKQCILIMLNVLQSNQPVLIRQLRIKVKVSFLLGIIQRNLMQLNLKTPEDILQLMQNEKQIQPKVHPKISDTIDAIIVLQKLQDCEGEQKFSEQKESYFTELNKSENPINLKQLIKTLRSQVLKIQIFSISSKKKQFVYFPNHPVLKTLSPTTRDRIMLNVSRSTQSQKIRSLFSYRDEITKQITHNFKIQKQMLLGIIPYQPAKMLQLQSLAFSLSFIINFIWFFSCNVYIQYFQLTYFIPKQFYYLLQFLNFVQLSITTLYFVSYYKCQYKLAAFRHNKQKKNKKKSEKQKSLLGKQGISEEQDGFQKKQGVLQHNQGTSMVQIPLVIIRTIVSVLISTFADSNLGVLMWYDSKFFYMLAYFLTSLIGTFYSQNIFLCYILFYFMQNDHLSNVFNAVVYNLRQLLSVGLLGVVFAFVFCLVFYEIYAIEMMRGAGEDVCTSIHECILDLYVSGRIGGSMKKFHFLRFITDLIFFIFFGLLFQNIVSGIMIDTFVQLRNKRDQMHEDKKNKCYICGKDRGKLQKNNQNFQDHIHQKHFLWNYIYYVYCLNQKHQTQYSGLQYQIKNCLRSQSTDQENIIKWIPFNTEEQVDYTSKVGELQTLMTNLTEEAKQKLKALQSQPEIEEQQAELADSSEQENQAQATY